MTLAVAQGIQWPNSLHNIHKKTVVFNHCALYFPYHVWAPSCWNTTSVSQLEADLEAASVQQLADNYLSLCRQCIRYQTADHTLHHTYIIDIHVCKMLILSLAQAGSRTAEDHPRTHAIRICGGQSDTGTPLSPIGIFAPVLQVRTSSLITTK